ncbi:GNAT family N-acetyltransferase [Nocardioides humi]|uniref:GNAT family N-acetyltransferase n=1 Tax=Nocardioides humi TaxID=449461 RepID=UPI001C6418B2|nr:GNAT family N-acetyltransferase [Nocardioides humi]
MTTPLGTTRVRRARSEEYAAVGELTLQAYDADGLLSSADETDDVYAPQLRDASRRDAEAEVWVAVDDADAVLGTVTWCPPGSPWRELAGGRDQAEFRMLAVPPAHRGRGVARELVAWCVRRASAEGMREILLSSLPAMTAAHGLYLSAGFRRAPELDHRPIPTVLLWAFRRDLPVAG